VINLTSPRRTLTAIVAMSLLGCAQTPDQKAQATLSAMTFEEKVRLLHGPMTRLVPKAKRLDGVEVGAGYIEGVPHLGVPHLIETDASLGVSNLMNMRKGDVATALPSGISLASSWDPELARAGGKMIGAEARAKGFNVMLVGGVNLVRDPRAGRNFEYLGEDPLLAGMLVGAQIDGVQSNHIIGTIKHLALNDQETGRNVHSVNMSEADMRESDLLAFEIGIEQGNPGSVMCAYNRVNGVYACENPFLLNHVLREDWGYKGFVMSDWGAVKSTEAILTGLDQQSGEQLDGKPHFSTNLIKAVEEGEIPITAIDTAARRVLYSIYDHQLDRYPVSISDIDYAANANVALEAAKEGIVLLQNESQLLPLDGSATYSIAVIGRTADMGIPSGGGSSQVTPVGGFTDLQRAFKKGPAATFAFRGWGGISPVDGIKAAFPNSQVTFNSGEDIAAASALAAKADVVIIVVEKYAAEAADHDDMLLGENQDDLITQLAQVNPRSVVVLQTGNPVAMPWKEQVGAIVSAWFSGQEGGNAIAQVLNGSKNPSGHLPVTFPASLAQLPNPLLPGSDMPPADKETRATYGLMAGTKPFDIEYPEGSDAGYRWFDKQQLTPLFPFGFGLSYTEFSYENLAISTDNSLTVNFSVTNSGNRQGKDVAQVYVTPPGKAKRLIGWFKPDLAPGETKATKVIADPRVLAEWNTEKHRWDIAEGIYTVEVSMSATQPVLVEQIELPAQSIPVKL